MTPSEKQTGGVYFLFSKNVFAKSQIGSSGKLQKYVESRWEKLWENYPHNLIIYGNIPRYFAWMLRIPLKYNQVCIVFLGKMWNYCRFTQNICVMTIISFYSNRAMRSASGSDRCLTKLIQNFSPQKVQKGLENPGVLPPCNSKSHISTLAWVDWADPAYNRWLSGPAISGLYR